MTSDPSTWSKAQMTASVKEAAARRDYAGSKLGMWLFLASVALLFAGPFLLFAAYGYRYPGGFAAASAELDVVLGAAGAMALLTGSLAVALAVGAVRRGRGARAVLFLYAAALLGFVFLGVRAVEWAGYLSRGLRPGGPALAAAPGGKAVFFGLYFFITGLHAFHVLGGSVLLLVMAAMVRRGAAARPGAARLEKTGLIWHMASIILVYIYQLFYITG